MKVKLCLVTVLLFSTGLTAAASPKPKAARTAASRFVAGNPRIGNYSLLRAVTRFRIARPDRWRFSPRPVASLMLPKATGRALTAPRPQVGSDWSKIEFYVGYAFTQFDGADDGTNLHGWNAAVAFYPFKHFGFVGDFGGGYISDSLVENGLLITGNASVHTFMGGPQARAGNDRLTFFARGLVGGARFKLEGRATVNGQMQSAEFRDNAFAAGAGGGLDLKLSDRISWRIFQTDYLLTRFLDDNQHSIRAATGFVFR